MTTTNENFSLSELCVHGNLNKGADCTWCQTDKDVAHQENVHHPLHYNQGDIECIDAMVQVFGKDAVDQYARINAFKYLWRHTYKNRDEDLKKALWYLRYSLGDDPRGTKHG